MKMSVKQKIISDYVCFNVSICSTNCSPSQHFLCLQVKRLHHDLMCWGQEHKTPFDPSSLSGCGYKRCKVAWLVKREWPAWVIVMFPFCPNISISIISTWFCFNMLPTVNCWVILYCCNSCWCIWFIHRCLQGLPSYCRTFLFWSPYH